MYQQKSLLTMPVLSKWLSTKDNGFQTCIVPLNAEHTMPMQCIQDKKFPDSMKMSIEGALIAQLGERQTHLDCKVMGSILTRGPVLCP